MHRSVAENVNGESRQPVVVDDIQRKSSDRAAVVTPNFYKSTIQQCCIRSGSALKWVAVAALAIAAATAIIGLLTYTGVLQVGFINNSIPLSQTVSGAMLLCGTSAAFLLTAAFVAKACRDYRARRKEETKTREELLRKQTSNLEPNALIDGDKSQRQEPPVKGSFFSKSFYFI